MQEPGTIPGPQFPVAYEAFVTASGGTFNVMPPFAAESHDAAYLCMRAIADAAAAPEVAGRRPTRAEVLDAMEALTTSPAFALDQPEMYTDPYIFDATRNVSGVYFARRISDGAITTTGDIYRCGAPDCESVRRSGR